jgi:1-acyl-sn-glycerol-3-phosphate acyltransferase
MTVEGGDSTRKLKRAIALGVLRLCGWRLTGGKPEHKRYIVLGAPHTSSWDFFFIFLIAWGNGVDFRWVGKKELFQLPHGWFFRVVGGIPVDRARSSNMVDALAAVFQANEELIILIPPEGTRRRVSKWKTGFYYTAMQAGIPFVLGYIDFRRKEAGLGPIVFPTGDYEADLRPVYEFYEGITPRHPERYESPLRSGERP